MPNKTMSERSRIAGEIDQMLATDAQTNDSAVIDLLLDWGLALARRVELADGRANLLINRIEALEGQLRALVASEPTK